MNSPLKSLLVCLVVLVSITACNEVSEDMARQKISDMACGEVPHETLTDLMWEKSIASGQCIGIEIGATKNTVAKRLSDLGVSFVWLGPPPTTVESEAGLSRLIGSEAIFVGKGEIYIFFDGDRVSQRLIAPHISDPLRRGFESATDREQVFSLLRKLIADREYSVSSYYTGPSTVDLVAGESDNPELAASDFWGAALRTEEGYWSLDLEFKSAVLATMRVRFSVVELP